MDEEVVSELNSILDEGDSIAELMLFSEEESSFPKLIELDEIKFELLTSTSDNELELLSVSDGETTSSQLKKNEHTS